MAKFSSQDLKQHKYGEAVEKKVKEGATKTDIFAETNKNVEAKLDRGVKTNQALDVDEKKIGRSHDVEKVVEKSIGPMSAYDRIQAGKKFGIVRLYDSDLERRDVLKQFKMRVSDLRLGFQIKHDQLIIGARQIPMVLLYVVMVIFGLIGSRVMYLNGNVFGSSSAAILIFVIVPMFVIILTANIYNRHMKRWGAKIVVNFRERSVVMENVGVRFEADEIVKFIDVSRDTYVRRGNETHDTRRSWVGFLIEREVGGYEYWVLWDHYSLRKWVKEGWKSYSAGRYLSQKLGVGIESVDAGHKTCDELGV
ncbi:hypothetical protein KS4_00020 [Poriferisphaera corsica]|uniref:Uncharacterized protein n=1 Tax=Poriferisphaera corsica TaxID=2528020 RepID=A0A517YP26_9BACT|nr:hypothetical protein [Poriferisphaera corsica]QDU31974.1 hypothetical protein KS4_00020 [Poriferisphaera corsica]